MECCVERIWGKYYKKLKITLLSANHTPLLRQIKGLDLSLNVDQRIHSHGTVIAVASTGIKVTSRGRVDAREVEGPERVD